MPAPRRRHRPGRPVVRAARRAGRGRRDARRPAAPRPYGRPGHRAPRPQLHRRRRLPRRRRLVRRRLLRHVPRGGPAHRPAAAAAAGDDRRGTGRRRHPRRIAGRIGHLRVRGRLRPRLRREPVDDAGPHQPAHHARRHPVHHGEPDVVRLRPARAEHGRRHGLLLRPRRPRPGLPHPARGHRPRRPGRRCQRAVEPLLLRRFLLREHAVPARALRGVLRRRRRVRPRRGRRGARPQAPRGRGGGRRPRPRRTGRHRQQHRRP
ncbi:hypothetical protein RKD28_001575 [Streptomyces sp. SAI-229]